MKTCDICPAQATKQRALGRHAVNACDEHAPFMDGWLRDMVDEEASENYAAARFEEMR